MAVPIPFQDPARSGQTGGDLFANLSERGSRRGIRRAAPTRSAARYAGTVMRHHQQGPKRDGDRRPHSAPTASDAIARWLLVGAAAAASHRGWRAVAAVAGAFTGVLSFRFGHHDAGSAAASSLLASLVIVRVRSLGRRPQQGDLSADGRGRRQAPAHGPCTGQGQVREGRSKGRLERNWSATERLFELSSVPTPSDATCRHIEAFSCSRCSLPSSNDTGSGLLALEEVACRKSKARLQSRHRLRDLTWQSAPATFRPATPPGTA